VPKTKGSEVSKYDEAQRIYGKRDYPYQNAKFDDYLSTRRAWKRSQDWRRTRNLLVMVWAILIALLVAIWAYLRFGFSFTTVFSGSQTMYFLGPITHNVFVFFYTVSGSFVLVATGFTLFYEGEKRRQWINEVLIESARKDQAAKADGAPAGPAQSPLGLDALWNANRAQIENYHKIVLSYASSSRIYTLTALSVGFIFIAVVGFIAVHASGTAAAISASIVTAVSAALTGFVARATLRNSEASSKELRAFFEHPLDLERALAAERLVGDMTNRGDQAQARLRVIDYLTRQRESGARRESPSVAQKLHKTFKPKSGNRTHEEDQTDREDEAGSQ
jgi:hypothetical protein